MPQQNLSEEQKKILSEQRAWMVATASKEGKPNIAAKGSKQILDDATLGFGEIFGGITYSNLMENPVVTIFAFDPAGPAQIRCVGDAEICTSGAIYDAVAEKLQSKGHPKPKAFIKVKLTEIR